MFWACKARMSWAILIADVMHTFVDPDFRAECAKQGIDCNAPASGDDLQKIVNDAYAPLAASSPWRGA